MTLPGCRFREETDKLLTMSLSDSSLLTRRLEKHLGRELTPAERRLLALAEEIIESEKGESEPHSKAQTASE